MKKNLFKLKGGKNHTRFLIKLLRIMKISIFLLAVSILQVFAKDSYSQTTKLSLSMNNVTVEQVLDKIENQSEFYFLYNHQLVDVNRKVNIDVTNKKINNILTDIFADTDIRYLVMGRQIILSPKDVLKTNTTKSSVAQQRVVTGKITDKDGKTIPGVNILIKGTQRGSVSDIDGNYSIEVSDPSTVLEFSFVGYESQEIQVDGKSVINVTMTEASIGLDEVVAIGYGYQKKSDLTGAISVVSDKELTLTGTVSNAAQAMQGKSAGVLVSQNSRAPGGSVSVRIRGSNSISSTNEPLYVIDGFPTRQQGTSINPNDIESIQILKDASATAIYGSRGANGVVLITTKRGKKGENHISYNGYFGVQSLQNPFDMLDGKSYMLLANELFKEIDGQENSEYGVYTQSQLQSDVNTDWIKESSRGGNIQNHTLQFTGGTEKTRVLSSIGYFSQQGILKNTDFNRVSGRINVDQDVTKFIRAGATIYANQEASNYQLYEGNILNSNILYSMLNYDPTVPPYNEDGSFGRPPGGKGDNPLANLLARENDLKKHVFNGNMYLEIEPIKGLKARVNGGVEIYNGNIGTYLPRSTYQGGIDNGVANTSNFGTVHQLLDSWITYDKTIEKHSFSVMGGYSYEKFVGESRENHVKNFSTDLFSYNNIGAASIITGVSSYKYENILISYFGRLNYSFNDKYLVTFTLRTDGSSRFGEENRWGLFPSGSFAWRLSQEPFIQNLGVFSNLKLRLGYGKTGNDKIGNYASYALMRNTHLTFDGITNQGGTHMNQGSPENPSLKWETTSQFNGGLDMGFFDSRLSVTLDAYYKQTNDLLIRIDLPAYSGFTSGQSNMGKIENKGFEFSITSNNFVGEFRWDTRFNFSVNRNQVLDLGRADDIYITSWKPVGNVSEEQFAIIQEGQPLGSLYGYKYIGVLQAGELYEPQPSSKPGDPKFADVSGPEGVPDGKITSDDRTIIGDANPKFIFGMTNTFSYKNLDLSIFFYGSVGNKIMNMTRMTLEWKRTTEALNRWTPDNTDTDLPRNGFFYSKYGGYINDHFIEDASFLRIRDITLGYTLPWDNVVKVRFYFSAENLLTFTKYTGWDPEVDTKRYENDPLVPHRSGRSTASTGNQTANAGAGLDFNSYPSMRTFTFGVNIDF